ncbi:MAG: glycosyltransferase family 1 protein [Microbacteriaceae bacterium]|nr:MAG: glycosyltransferase family 1 protein [Microbacteriaceae bacterium]
MKIVVDCRYTRIGRHDGISRYTAGIVAELAKLHPVTMLISDHRQLELLPSLPWEIISAPTSIREPFVAHQVNRLHPDVVFTPMQTMGAAGRRYKLVLTVHDLIYYRNRTPPRDFAWPIRLLWRLYHLAWWPQRLLLNRADAVVTVSQTTRALIREHNLTRRPVHVVSNAADPPTTALAGQAAGRSAPTSHSLVYMGSYMPYKNVETLVRAVALLPGYRLHLMSHATPAEQARLQALAPGTALVFHDGASDAEYHEELAAARALVSASLDEGFGIPLVEAMALGTPVVVSDIPIFREIGADAALFFDPHSVEDLARAIRSLEDPQEWARRSAQSIRTAGGFTWAGSAEHLLTVLTATVSRASGRRRL